MTRRRLLALVLAPTLLVGLGLGAALVVDARARQVDVDRADAVAPLSFPSPEDPR